MSYFIVTGYISSSAVAAIGRGPNSTSLTLFALGSADETILREIANTDSEVRFVSPFNFNHCFFSNQCNHFRLSEHFFHCITTVAKRVSYS